MDTNETLDVLKQLERGEINAAEAEDRLNAPPRVERMETAPNERVERPRWAQWLSLYIGGGSLVVVALGAWIMAASGRPNLLWFILGLPLMLLGSLVFALAATVQFGHWLFVDIQEGRENRRRIRFAIPFPLGLARGGLRIARWFGQRPRASWNRHPRGRNANMDWAIADDLMKELEHELDSRHAFTVDVNEDGERVQVYLI